MGNSGCLVVLFSFQTDSCLLWEEVDEWEEVDGTFYEDEHFNIFLICCMR